MHSFHRKNVESENFQHLWFFDPLIFPKWTKSCPQEVFDFGVTSLCMFWKKWDFNESLTVQRTSKKFKITNIDSTLLRSVSDLDRGQPRNDLTTWKNRFKLCVYAFDWFKKNNCYILMKIWKFQAFYIFYEISKFLCTDCAKTTRWIILIPKDSETKIETLGQFLELWSLDR